MQIFKENKFTHLEQRKVDTTFCFNSKRQLERAKKKQSTLYMENYTIYLQIGQQLEDIALNQFILGRETVLFFLIVLCARFSRQNTFLRRRTLRTWLYTCVVTILGLACQSNKMFPITKRYSSTKTSTRSKNSRRIVGTGY